jgi:hypothetical protein
MIDAWKLAKEISSALSVNKTETDLFPLFIEAVISYHLNENKPPRNECKWGCAELDENKHDGWYDGYMCPTCGYVRGMYKQP